MVLLRACEISKIKFIHIRKVVRLIGRTLKLSNSRDYNEEVLNNLLRLYSHSNFKKLVRKRTCYILKLDKKIIGTVCIRKNRVYTLFVDPDYQGNGYGKMLLEFAESKIMENGYVTVELSASLTARNFYRSMGYRELDYEKDNSYGDVINMEKRLIDI